MITRLITSEEILGEVNVSDDGTTCTIKNPTQIGVSPNPHTKNVDIHMAPFMPLAAGKSITLSMSAVLCQYEPVQDVVNKYNSMFGSGLILPKNSGIATI